MNADRLLKLYDRVADAPDAIPKLRRFILDLAVRGKLVPQDPKDEPASELLKRIAAEKARLGKTSRGRISEGRERAEEFAYVPPPGWAITTLGGATLKITDGAHHTPTYVESGVPFVSVKDFSGGQLSLSNTRFITEEQHRQLYTRCDPKRGDILIGRIGTLGRAVLIDTDVEFSVFVSVGLIRFSHKNIEPEFFRLMLNSPLVEKEFDRIKIGGGTHTNKLNLGDLKTVALPLPPLAEQDRIVAKVAELMALCDKLEAARIEREGTRDRLAAASLERLNTPDPETFREDTLFALGALPSLMTRPDQIKKLRQTIVNLAVSGKLVPQDPAEGRSTELLIELETASADARNGGRRRKGAAIADISAEERYLEIPFSWAWVRICQVGITQTGTSPSSSSSELFGKFIPFVKPADLDGHQISYDGPGLSEQGMQHSRVAMPKSVLMVCIGATLGKVNVTDRRICFNQQINSVTPHIDGTHRYISLALKASGFQRLAWSKAGTGTLPIISKGKWEVLPIPLPPLAEQHRIVAKVDELMAMCDSLERALESGESIRSRLLNALLAEALAPQEAQETPMLEAAS